MWPRKKANGQKQEKKLKLTNNQRKVDRNHSGIAFVIFWLWESQKRKIISGNAEGKQLLLWLKWVKPFAAAAAKSLQLCSVWPHRRQPTRLPRPWDSPGKNTGVGCHFLLQCMEVKVKLLSCVDSSRPHGLQPTRLLHPWDFSGKSTGMGCLLGSANLDSFKAV